MMFAIPDPQYWKFCCELASSQSMIDQIKSKEAIDIMGSLRDLDMLKDDLTIKYCEKLSSDLDSMTIESLTDYLTIMNSEESKEAHLKAQQLDQMQQHINKVVQKLTQSVDSLTEANYGKLIHAFDDDNDYAAFLEKTSKLVMQMIQDGAINMNDAPHVMRAYDNDKDRINGGQQMV